MQLTKYHHCVGKLPIETVASIEDVMNNFGVFADPYEELKKGLCWAYGHTEQQKVNELLDLPPLGSDRLSVLMDNILTLWPDVTTKLTSKLLLDMFLHRFPEQMRAQLANYLARDPNQLAAAANAIWAQYGSKFPSTAAELTVAAATGSDNRQGRSLSPQCNNNNCSGRSKSHGGGSKSRGSIAQTPGWKDSWKEEWCLYHNNWASKAQKCENPCSYPAKGN